MPKLLTVSDLKKYFPVRAGVFGRMVNYVRAVDGVNFTIFAGETLGLVGESGCGKTTVGRTILRLTEPTTGSIRFKEVELTTLKKRQLRSIRTEMQLIFQDPFSSLNPRRVVLDLVGEGLSEHHLVKNLTAKKEHVVRLLEMVGLSGQILYRYPHEFSGGQRQRIAIARAISLKPALLVCDEPVSALDVSIQAQILNLLINLQKRLGLSYLFIAHDLAVVKQIAQRIAVMYLGQIVELAPTEELFQNPLHPYTQALLSAVPVPDPHVPKKRIILKGEIGEPNYHETCSFALRCPVASANCQKQKPEAVTVNQEHMVRCIKIRSTIPEDRV